MKDLFQFPLKIRYRFYVSSRKLDPEKICKKGTESLELHGSVKFKKETEFMRNFLLHSEKKNFTDENVCRNAIQHTAYLKFQLTGSKFIYCNIH